MAFKLICSDKSQPWSTIFHSEQGEPLYRTERLAGSSWTTGPSQVAIYKIHNKAHAKFDYEKFDSDSTLDTESLSLFQQTDLASFRLRSWHADELTINGREMKDGELFEKPMGIRAYGRDRVWKGPDGQEYRWEMGCSKPELFKNVDGKKGPVAAKYHRQHSGFMGVHDKTVASLDIFGDLSEPLLDMIVVTFVYMETARAKREREAAQANASNASSAGVAAAVS